MTVLAALLAVTSPLAGAAQEAGDATSEPMQRPLITQADSLAEFLWVARPVIVFADTPNDPRYIRQIELLQSRPQDLFERDVVVLTDTDPSANSELRRTLRPRGFQLVIVGKDGSVALRKPAPWDVREITRSIDRMPLRRQEIRDRRNSSGEG
jgi:hypothetical protein